MLLALHRYRGVVFSDSKRHTTQTRVANSFSARYSALFSDATFFPVVISCCLYVETLMSIVVSSGASPFLALLHSEVLLYG